MAELCALVVGLAAGAVAVSQWEIDRRAMPRWERWGWTVLVGVGACGACGAVTVRVTGPGWLLVGR